MTLGAHCYVCGRGLSAGSRSRVRPATRLILAIANLATPCNRLACWRRTQAALTRRLAR